MEVRRMSTVRWRCEQIVCLMLVTLLGGCSTPGDNKCSTAYGQVELLRDRWGVPHIFAETDAGAMYGLGFATAQDRAFQMYYGLRIIQGRLAEHVGDVKVGVTRRRPQGTNSALRNDVKMRTIGYYRAAEETARQLGPEERALLEAYSQGVNDYIGQHPNDLLHLFKTYNLEPEPWTPAACIACWWRMGLFFAGDGLREMGTYYDIKEGRRQVKTFAPARDSKGAIGSPTYPRRCLGNPTQTT